MVFREYIRIYIYIYDCMCIWMCAYWKRHWTKQINERANSISMNVSKHVYLAMRWETYRRLFFQLYYWTKTMLIIRVNLIRMYEQYFNASQNNRKRHGYALVHCSISIEFGIKIYFFVVGFPFSVIAQFGNVAYFLFVRLRLLLAATCHIWLLFWMHIHIFK